MRAPSAVLRDWPEPVSYTHLASCDIVWKDAEMPYKAENVIIKLSTDIVESEDDRIFYYCENLEELKSLTEYSGEDFTVVEFYNFIEI